MKNPKRIAVIDRSVLARNLYHLLLKPQGFSLFSFATLHEFRRHFNGSFRLNALLINSNALGKNPEGHLEWLALDPRARSLPVVFVCEKKENKILSRLKKAANGAFLYRPFEPAHLGEKIRAALKERRPP